MGILGFYLDFGTGNNAWTLLKACHIKQLRNTRDQLTEDKAAA